MFKFWLSIINIYKKGLVLTDGQTYVDGICRGENAH